MFQGMGWTLLGPALVNLEVWFSTDTSHMVLALTALGAGFLGKQINVDLPFLIKIKVLNIWVAAFAFLNHTGKSQYRNSIPIIMRVQTQVWERKQVVPWNMHFIPIAPNLVEGQYAVPNELHSWVR